MFLSEPLLAHVVESGQILDRFLHHADIITITGKSYRLRNQTRRTKSHNTQTDSKNDQKGKE